MSSSSSTSLRFEPFRLSVDPDFWILLEESKLKKLKLSLEPLPAVGFYSTLATQSLDGLVSDAVPEPEPAGVGVPSGEAPAAAAAPKRKPRKKASVPSMHFRFTHESFTSDNALSLDPFTCLSRGTLHITNTLEEFKKIDKTGFLRDAGTALYQRFLSSTDWMKDPSVLNSFACLCHADLKKHVFLYNVCFPVARIGRVGLRPGTDIERLPDADDMKLKESYRRLFVTSKDNTGRGFFAIDESSMTVLPLSAIATWDSKKELSVGYCDCSGRKSRVTFAWQLRNFFAGIWMSTKRQEFSVYVFRHTSVPIERFFVEMPKESIPTSISDIKFVGWHKAVRKASIASLMDPTRLAESSVNLNLQLMKWRLFPELDMSKLASTKALLVGSGTLGCHVARNLMSWGIFDITMLDRGKVSHSNPVRQPLFEFVDVGKDKAECAKDHLLRIYPKCNARSFNIDIPMPGHPVAPGDVQAVEKNAELLERLISESTVVFLLTDTRESRWLPAMLGMYHKKLVINAALGFESFLVMRHGIPGCGGDRLGCYFCSDVVDPVDSTADRTLDQQCTVTRPGGSAMAGGLAVELLVALLHHPAGYAARTDEASPLGSVPHQIRGSLSSFQNLILQGKNYSQCIACSDKVLEAYAQEKFAFLLRVFNEPKVLSKLTGLAELQEKTMKLLEAAMKAAELEGESFDEDGFDLL